MNYNQDAIDNAKAWFESIREMVAEFDAAMAAQSGWLTTDLELLSVQVRSGWYVPRIYLSGSPVYEILLSAGGPALRIVGEMNEHGEPTSAVLEWQDWGTPWTLYVDPAVAASERGAILISFASHFYFGGTTTI